MAEGQMPLLPKKLSTKFFINYRPFRSFMDRVTFTNSFAFRTLVLARHLNHTDRNPSPSLEASGCLNYSPPEVSERVEFDTAEMRKILDGHHVQDRDWLFGLMRQSKLFCPTEKGGRVFVVPDYNQSKEQQSEMTMKRIAYLLEKGTFEGWLTAPGPEAELKKLALLEVLAIYDHSLAIKLGTHFCLWGGAIQFMGTKSHHKKWLRDTENYNIKGCFAMTELGHGSNVQGIGTLATYDSSTEEFVINTPFESAQKYWIGGGYELKTNGEKQGVHAFIAQIRDANGNICPNVRIADCGHKIGLNGVDNGRLWFDNLRIPRENMLNSVGDVSPDGQYHSDIKDPDQRFAAFLAPLTSTRVSIAVSAIYTAKVGLAIAIRYALTRRAFSIAQGGSEVILLDYPSHQRRLLPLLVKTYAMSSVANYLKMIYVRRTPESHKTIHVFSSAFKATFTWHNMRSLQECREAVGGQGLKTENRVGHLKGEYDVQSTFEGDNNVLMQQVSKALFAEYVAATKRNGLFRGLGLEHMNNPFPVIPAHLSSYLLRSIQFQADLLCLRERDLLVRFSAEISNLQAGGESKANAFARSYQLAEDLGKAFAERTIFQIFSEDEAAQPTGSLKNTLGLLRSMYVLISVEEDPAFLRYGYMSTDNAVAVRKEVVKLCNELRPHALALVTSLGIPDAYLAPIAYNWIEANSWSSQQR